MSAGKTMCHCGERDLTPWQPSPNSLVWVTDERNVRHGLHGCEAQPVSCACGDVLLPNDGHTVRTDYRATGDLSEQAAFDLIGGQEP